VSTAAVTSTPDTGVARPGTRASRTGVDRRAMAMLSAGHLFTDVGQGSIPALLPFLIVKDHLSYAGASALILAATIASSVIQPVFGHLSDRRSLPWLMPLGPILGGVGVALAAIAPSYALSFAAVVLSGIGVAAFHPEGSRFANYVSGAKRSSGMSLFSVGGNIGFALGPALITPLVLAFGLSGTLLVIVPTSLMGVVLARELPRLKTFRVDLAKRHAVTDADEDAWRPFTLLAVVIALRSFVYFGFVTFIPLYFIHDLHTSRGIAGAALTVMLVGGAIGTLVGGRLADRFGRRSVLIGSMAVLPFLTVGFLVSPPGPAMVFAGVAGAATIATFAVTIVMGQEFLPGRIGVASGVTIGLSVGMGGVAAPLLGILADGDGLRAVFELIVVFPLAALLLSLALPVRRDPAPAARAAVGAGAAARPPARAANTNATVASVTAAE
jgi:FSR family fosmidomycin resistance protein-like MFS transporter